MLGETLSHYKILRKLGEGGMGEVYLAEDTRLKRQVALKVLPPEMAGDPNRLERFQREAEAIAALDHPNIVTIFSVEEADGAHFLTMSYVDGQTLDAAIPEGGMDLDRLFQLAIPMADALAAAHEKGITHRDLKPANVMVTEDGRVKVLDFGLAKLQEDMAPAGDEEPTRALTREGLVVGTVPYMSPEQVEGRVIDHRSDIFSFGVLLYEMATGDRPFRGENSAQVVSSILRDDPPSVAERKAELPFHLSRIVRHCLEKDPKKRFQSALDVRNDLEGLKGEVASGHIRPASSSTAIPAQPQSPARPKWLWPAVAGAAVVVAALVWTLVGRGTDPATRPSPRDSAPTQVAKESGKPSLAVLYFDNLTGDSELDWLRTGLTDMLVTDLSQIPDLKVVGTDRVYQILKDLDLLDEPITSADAVREVAARASAGTVLLGSFAKAGETLRISVKVQDAATGEILTTERVDGPAGDNIFAMVDELSRGVRGQFATAGAVPIDTDRELMLVSTDSIEAYRFYADAVHFADQGLEEEAIPLLEKAVEIDPTFAMALRKLAVVLGNDGRDVESREAARRAVEHAERLPAREKYLVEAYYYSDQPRTLAKAIAAYESILELEPDNETALNNLGLHLNQLERYEEALALLERGAQNSSYLGIYTNLVQSLAGLGRWEEREAAIAELESRAPGTFLVARLRGSGEVYRGDPARALEYFAEVDRKRPGAFEAAVMTIHAHILLEQWGEGREYAERMIASSNPVTRRNGQYALARIARFQGRIREAVEIGTRMLEEHPEQDIRRADLEVDHGFVLLEVGDPSEASAIFDKARAASEGEWQEIVATWGLAEARLALGDTAAAATELERFRQITREIPSRFPQRGEHMLKARIAAAEEDFSTALKELAEAEALLPPAELAEGDFTDIRYGQAEAFLGTGDTAKAEQKLLQIVRSQGTRLWRPEEYVRSFYLLGQLALERGDLEQARTYYQRFLDHWADGELDRDRVAQARRVIG